MRAIFFTFICILFTLSECVEAGIPSQETDTTESPLRNHILLGFNATQVIVGDVELHSMLRFKKRYSIMVGVGYDFNLLDFGNPIELEEQCDGCNEREGESNASGRYFWGNGMAYRFIVSDSYTDKNVSHFFASLYLVYKHHNYENYYYGDGNKIHCESADQQIFGVGFYFGYESLKKNSIIRPYGGIGLRTLDSQISRPPIYNGQTIAYSGANFSESYAYPAIDFGLIFLFKVRK